MSEDRQYAPATLRNRDFILDVLPATGVIRGRKAARASTSFIAREISRASFFQPSDPDPRCPAEMGEGHGCHKCTRAIALDALHSVWPIASADGINCINMSHISPWEATVGLIKGAATILPSRSPLYFYGSYLGSLPLRATKPSTEVFAIAIRTGSARTRSGRRDGAICWILGSVITEMPANNLSVVFRRV
jgi:Protein of unknown function (DUF938)